MNGNGEYRRDLLVFRCWGRLHYRRATLTVELGLCAFLCAARPVNQILPQSWHCLGPVDMSFEAKRFRHIAVARHGLFGRLLCIPSYIGRFDGPLRIYHRHSALGHRWLSGYPGLYVQLC